MNATYQIHHAEQMEAARFEFETLWAMKLKPILFMFRVDDRASDADFGAIKQACWVAFVAHLSPPGPRQAGR